MSKLIRKVLVSNRGQIACRIIRTAKKMGIQTVAIHSDIDKNSKYVQMADKAYRVGPNSLSESYLNSKKIIQIALQSGCQALHPGFGFLSQNAGFAEQCQNAKLAFIGPPASAIRKMGSKSESKNIMTQALVPVVPGYHQTNQDPQFLLQQAIKIGFPVLIKAVSGGGGKGMRIVFKKEDFHASLINCKNQALNSFKDDNVLIEKYITRPRHIEIQVFGDKHKNYVHLFQRDCSIQRRHQKVIEQAPSNISDVIRQNIYQSAVNAARAVGYYNAGTVQFIFDLDSNKHYFMEMNTRLQVQHPITEMITGQDLVQWQFLVASGFELPKKQQQLKRKGHAIQCRVYSENPYHQFLPQSGKLAYFKEPKEKQNAVRIETGVRQHDQISTYYDAMIAKLITYASTRGEAINLMRNALKQYRIAGIYNNVKFLKNVLENPVFIEGHYDTSFIKQNLDDLIKKTTVVQNFDLASAIAVKLAVSFSKVQLPKELVGYRNGGKAGRNKYHYKIQATASYFEKQIQNQVIVDIVSNEYAFLTINKVRYAVSFKNLTQNTVNITFENKTVTREFYQTGQQVYLFDQNGDTVEYLFTQNLLKAKKVVHGSQKVYTAPMTGTLCYVVKPGDKVTKGQVLFKVFAMKMQHSTVSEIDSTVKSVYAKVNDVVESGQQIVLLQ